MKKTAIVFVLILLCGLLLALAAIIVGENEIDQHEARDDKNTEPAIVRQSCPSLLYSDREVECGRYFPRRDPARRAMTQAADIGQFYLPYVIFRAENDGDKPPLVYIAGGPGDGMQTHLDQLQGWAYWLEQADLEQDLVVYDQRGLMPGQPYWDCRPYDQISRDILAADLSVEEEYARTSPVLEKCLQQFDSWLRSPQVAATDGIKSFSSIAAAADLRGLLAALDYQQWNLWGVSYGTRVALVAAQQESERVRSLVLDSPYPLDRGESTEKPKMYAQALERFWRECTHNTALCGADVSDPQQLFWQAVDWLQQHPQTFRVRDAQGESLPFVLNGQRFITLTLFSLYDHRLYSDLVESLLVIQQAIAVEHWPEEERSTDTLRFLINSLVTSAFAKDFNTMVFFAIECNDNPLQSADAFREAVIAQPGLEPFLAPGIERDPCELPLFDSADLLSAEPAPTVPSLILVGELDPVTPVSWARALVQQLPQSQLIQAPQTSHAVISSGVCDPLLLSRFLEEPGEFVGTAEGGCY